MGRKRSSKKNNRKVNNNNNHKTNQNQEIEIVLSDAEKKLYVSNNKEFFLVEVFRSCDLTRIDYFFKNNDIDSDFFNSTIDYLFKNTRYPDLLCRSKNTMKIIDLIIDRYTSPIDAIYTHLAVASAKEGKLNILKYIASKGYDLNNCIGNKESNSLLLYALTVKFNEPIIDFLIKNISQEVISNKANFLLYIKYNEHNKIHALSIGKKIYALADKYKKILPMTQQEYRSFVSDGDLIKQENNDSYDYSNSTIVKFFCSNKILTKKDFEKLNIEIIDLLNTRVSINHKLKGVAAYYILFSKIKYSHMLTKCFDKAESNLWDIYEKNIASDLEKGLINELIVFYYSNLYVHNKQGNNIFSNVMIEKGINHYKDNIQGKDVEKKINKSIIDNLKFNFAHAKYTLNAIDEAIALFEEYLEDTVDIDSVGYLIRNYMIKYLSEKNPIWLVKAENCINLIDKQDIKEVFFKYIELSRGNKIDIKSDYFDGLRQKYNGMSVIEDIMSEVEFQYMVVNMDIDKQMHRLDKEDEIESASCQLKAIIASFLFNKKNIEKSKVLEAVKKFDKKFNEADVYKYDNTFAVVRVLLQESNKDIDGIIKTIGQANGNISCVDVLMKTILSSFIADLYNYQEDGRILYIEKINKVAAYFENTLKDLSVMMEKDAYENSENDLDVFKEVLDKIYQDEKRIISLKQEKLLKAKATEKSEISLKINKKDSPNKVDFSTKEEVLLKITDSEQIEKSDLVFQRIVDDKISSERKTALYNLAKCKDNSFIDMSSFNSEEIKLFYHYYSEHHKTYFTSLILGESDGHHASWQIDDNIYGYSDDNVVKIKDSMFAIIDFDSVGKIDSVLKNQFIIALKKGFASRVQGHNGIKLLDKKLFELKIKGDQRLYTTKINVNDDGDSLIIFDKIANHKKIDNILKELKSLDVFSCSSIKTPIDKVCKDSSAMDINLLGDDGQDDQIHDQKYVANAGEFTIFGLDDLD